MIQEWIEFDVELRLFFIEPQCEWDDERNCPKPMQPKDRSKFLSQLHNIIDAIERQTS